MAISLGKKLAILSVFLSLGMLSESKETFKGVKEYLENVPQSIEPNSSPSSFISKEKLESNNSSKSGYKPNKLASSWAFGTGDSPISWSLPGLSNGNVTLNLAGDSNSSRRPKPPSVPISTPGRCPDQDEVCDSSCRDYGKTGGYFCYDQNNIGNQQLSCQCYCQAPAGSTPINGTISPCTNNDNCSALCKHNLLTAYPAGGLCVRNACQCLCQIQDPYDPSTPLNE